MVPLKRYIIIAAALNGLVFAGDIALPLDDGNIIIRDAQFKIVGSNISEISYTLVNQTSSDWRTLKLQFEVKTTCAQPDSLFGERIDETRQMTVPMYVNNNGEWALTNHATVPYTQSVTRFFSNMNWCKTVEINSVSLIFAENDKIQIDVLTGERTDMEKQRQGLAEAERRAAEAQAKKDAAEAARRRQLAAEQKKKDAELNARIAKSRAEREAAAAEEERKLRANCTLIYQNTIDTKVKDLTVREEQQVRACQVLGLYPPR
jgi:hypothetical protein